MGTEPTVEWDATATQASPDSVYASVSANWTHNWGTITTGSSDNAGTLLLRLTGAGQTWTSASFYIHDDGASSANDPVPDEGWISAGTLATDEQVMSSGSSLDLVNTLTNGTETVLMMMTVPGGASGGTQAFDYRVKYTWA